MPAHLQPQAQSLNKAAKQQMWLLHQQAKLATEASSAEELQKVHEKLVDLQAKEAAKLQSLKKATGASSPEKENKEVVCQPRTPFRGKHRASSVPAKGTPARGSEQGTLGTPAENPLQVDFTAGDTTEEDSAPRKKSKSRSRKKNKKTKEEEEPEEGSPNKEEPKKEPPEGGGGDGGGSADAAPVA